MRIINDGPFCYTWYELYNILLIMLFVCPAEICPRNPDLCIGRSAILSHFNVMYNDNMYNISITNTLQVVGEYVMILLSGRMDLEKGEGPPDGAKRIL